MKIFWESRNWSGSLIEQGVTCMTWMNSPNTPGRGLLGTGTETGAVGVTYTDLDGSDHTCSKRQNFNLRGHQNPIYMVAWNNVQTKFLSCDINGVIYLWVPNDNERWTVELVNDRGFKVRDFCWSPNGQMALICYEDNFVLIGSATGQRIWSNTFLFSVLCGAWAPTSTEAVLGLNTGSIQVMNEQGALITERSNILVIDYRWNDKRLFQVGVRLVAFSSLIDGIRPGDSKKAVPGTGRLGCDQHWTLAVCSQTDQILFLNSFYEVDPSVSWQSCDPIVSIRWSSTKHLLAVICSPNRIVILNNYGQNIHSFSAPIPKDQVLTAFTWIHDDHAIVVAANGHIAVGRVDTGVPSLSANIAYNVWELLGRTSTNAHKLPLPKREQLNIAKLDRHIIRCRVPYFDKIGKTVCTPSNYRWYCTIIPLPKKTYQYMLCIEHMGGFVPILLGRQLNRIVPHFVISLAPHLMSFLRKRDRELQRQQQYEEALSHGFSTSAVYTGNVGASARVEDAGVDGALAAMRRRDRDSNRLQSCRNTIWRQSKRRLQHLVSRTILPSRSSSPKIPRAAPPLVEVISNVWCTKFKIVTARGDKTGSPLPYLLAQILYKTSVLHLQPRQMTVSIADLTSLGEEEVDTSKDCPESESKPKNCSNAVEKPDAAGEGSNLISRFIRLLDTPSSNNGVELRKKSLAVSEKECSTKFLKPGNTFSAGQNDVITLARDLDIVSDGEESERETLLAMSKNELQTYKEVVEEFDGLKQVVNTYISKMEQFAADLAEQQKKTSSPDLTILRSVNRPTSSLRLASTLPTSVQTTVMEADIQPLSMEAGPSSGTRNPIQKLMHKKQKAQKPLTPSQNSHQQHKQSRKVSIAGRNHQPMLQSYAGPERIHGDAGQLGMAPNWNSLIDKIEFIDDDSLSSSSSTDDLDDRPSDLGIYQNFKSDEIPLIAPPPPPPPASNDEPSCSTTTELTNLLASHERELDQNQKANNSKADLLTTSTKKQQLNDVRALVERLSKLAVDLSTRSSTIHSVKPFFASIVDMGVRQNERKYYETSTSTTSIAGGETTIDEKEVLAFRAHVRYIARQVSQFEELIRINDLLNEIRGDLRHRVRRIKNALGEDDDVLDGDSSDDKIPLLETMCENNDDDAHQSIVQPSQKSSPKETLLTTCDGPKTAPKEKIKKKKEQSNRKTIKNMKFGKKLEIGNKVGAIDAKGHKMLVVQNKTPFWNEQSQVYQLDFNGRVTQESAKNFQIEYKDKQVLQFGRIENGAYTLDFCEPFSAIQAFGIALASITQRLK